MLRLAINSIPELAKLLGFLGNEQRLAILRAIGKEEKYAREISEELGISRPLVNIYIKQFEKLGLVEGRSQVSEETPYFRRYYKSVPFELVVSLEVIQKIKEE
ncbi:Bacterial regulatory protein, arsR family [uncultured archaeon]|nr:Bacterial regulatory protein, arsR family [uncultured archaeon]